MLTSVGLVSLEVVQYLVVIAVVIVRELSSMYSAGCSPSDFDGRPYRKLNLIHDMTVNSVAST
jgi:hypothetical protein